MNLYIYPDTSSMNLTCFVQTKQLLQCSMAAEGAQRCTGSPKSGHGSHVIVGQPGRCVSSFVRNRTRQNLGYPHTYVSLPFLIGILNDYKISISRYQL